MQAAFAPERRVRHTVRMRSVAILGASTNPEKYGHRAVVTFAEKGFEVYPVNPRATQIADFTCVPDLDAVPVRPDVVSAYLPPALLLDVLPSVAGKGCDELWLNPGTDTPEIVERARELGLNPVIGCSLVALSSGRLSVEDE